MSTTYRQVQNAVGLVIAGAMRDVDNGTTSMSFIEVYEAVLNEVRDWIDGTFSDEQIDALGKKLDSRLAFGGKGVPPQAEEEGEI